MTKQISYTSPDHTMQSVIINGQTYFVISNIDKPRPFFMTLVSDSDIWLFITSNGGITAGRVNATQSLFPYYTDDRLITDANHTGSKTLIKIHQENDVILWEPFAVGVNMGRRNLYKSTLGNSIIFEEVRDDIGLTFQYQLNFSKEDGIVKTSSLFNSGDIDVDVEVIDGLHNIMPADVPNDLQNRASNLIDAYRKTELIEPSGIGIYALSAIITDKTEPAEALFANVVYSLGLSNPKFLLSTRQFENFANGLSPNTEIEANAEKGAYFVYSRFQISGHSSAEWMVIADVRLSQSQIMKLSTTVTAPEVHIQAVRTHIIESSQRLKQLVASADGLQKTADYLTDTRHFNNVLFNIMRGGIFDDNYSVQKSDLLDYLAKRNAAITKASNALLGSLDAVIDYTKLGEFAAHGHIDLYRLIREYLPLRFSRRHGDPSRPWNVFNIHTYDKFTGKKILNFEGNWRDIFQNWEALLWSYPMFVEGIIFRFLNASTFEGYNPYRITKTGIDWEIVEPEDPWSFIGYWGDHQIIYLLKLLEFASNFSPEMLVDLASKPYFVYANVPYKIHTYDQICSNPKDTITFDVALDHKLKSAIEDIGTDAVLLCDEKGCIIHVNLIEKLLATLLGKISNFIPGAGIWMNTQRPEWNDANNALVGNGASVVTVYYTKRFVNYLVNLLDKLPMEAFDLSNELAVHFHEVAKILNDHLPSLDTQPLETISKSVIDALGNSASHYRWSIYDKGFSGTTQSVASSSLRAFCLTTLQFLEHTIAINKRKDGLYHGYNLISYSENVLHIDHLPVMLEGQVGILSARFLDDASAENVLHQMWESDLFRADQNSFLLYPNKRLDGFLQKNSVTVATIANHGLVHRIQSLKDCNILVEDVSGQLRFSGHLINARILNEELSKHPKIPNIISKQVLALYEFTFRHKAFTGRSGTFYGYEGLGSIYWHMVSKLRLAVIELLEQMRINGKQEKHQFDTLAAYYYKICNGIGVHKSPQVYGAFPTDPYSHTPFNKGAQQPGMTGQVKEDILCRWKELGLSVNDGTLSFIPFVLKLEEFTNQSGSFIYFDVYGNKIEIDYPKEAIVFTYCQVPVIYTIGEKKEIVVHLNDNTMRFFDSQTIDRNLSKEIFYRSGKVESIVVSILNTQLLTNHD